MLTVLNQKVFDLALPRLMIREKRTTHAHLAVGKVETRAQKLGKDAYEIWVGVHEARLITRLASLRPVQHAARHV
jgi:hypothetical protein